MEFYFLLWSIEDSGISYLPFSVKRLCIFIYSWLNFWQILTVYIAAR